VLFHLERKGRPTVGCTSLKASRLDALIAWLSPKAEACLHPDDARAVRRARRARRRDLPELP